MWKWAALVAGGAAGTLARFLISGSVQRVTGWRFPFGTLVVNATGCFLVGLFDALAEHRFAMAPAQRLLLVTGFCGAYTTFSSFLLETANLLKAGEPGRAAVNVIASLAVGFLCLYAGMAAGRSV
jgi:CrcB protein